MLENAKFFARALLAATMIFAADNKSLSHELSSTVTEDEAHALAASTLISNARRLPGMRFDRELHPHPSTFYWFEITANVPNGESPLLGYFAVNKKTGDVWNWVQCIKLTSSVIRRFQNNLRQHRKMSDAEFHKMAGEDPCQP